MSNSGPPNIVQALLQHRSRLWRGKVLLLVACGIPLCFVGPCAAADVIWVVAGRLGYRLPLGTLFWGSTAILIPLLLLHQYRHRTSMTEQLLERPPLQRLGLFPIPLRQSQAMARQLYRADPRNLAAPFVDVFLFGPKLLFDARDERAAQQEIANVDLAQAEQIVTRLARAGEGLNVVDLIDDTQQSADAAMTLAWLEHHEIIGVNKERDRVWLRTEAKEWLTRAAQKEAEKEAAE